ncbi:DUF1996 domain-containing protein [Streptomyces sp. LX-29]|uniref:DUF1996 domain-containing protein n=1 Tax=Streptomyces sp. LX-29 TaxID=2900152 RepID=UPI00240E984C|nr:DUF1996 domain-containing protein [Streptomyces sp. LX-29]WFB10926.1 DUF1996 domain-containing protein [Streptomyces sp. LX-29]
MREQSHKRARFARPYVVLASVLALGAGGVAVIAANASAGNSSGPEAGRDTGGANTRQRAQTIDCPDVGDRLRDVPAASRRTVDRNLAQLDVQVADAYRRLTSGRATSGTVLIELKDKRGATIGRIVNALRSASADTSGLTRMSGCQVKWDTVRTTGQTGGQGPGQGAPGQDQGQGAPDQGQGQGQQGQGPSRGDFVDIRNVRPNVNEPGFRGNGSTGTFTSECGRNENGRFNSDNVIVAPGVSNGAHHMHDYVGNDSTDGFSTNESLAASGTTCGNGDQSTYYWPVLRVRDGRQERDVNAPGGGIEGNVGTILTPSEVSIEFRGSPVSRVTPMPRFLRIITGDAKSFTNGTANANASWTCTGFENRELTDKYPICPGGSKVVRTFRFQSCWDGRNIDSANHRTHVAFADDNGVCPQGFRAIPQLVQRITYDVPGGAVFAVDSFPEQLHKPVTDHGDFINVMSNRLMARAAGCINSGRDCG